ncbi:ABC transporter, solute-binding protein [Marvinbryantia formatexigens DSM 14469]|uniref:ABC transporter, solute-binding protein n=1 Tax=Marvinbryantia formatexigens DSM 14469 TaxID=478749 RepID=C6L9A7_9FIRM|nr:ABC transporter substrate-binding protein [Marvinbryantia formatexigens]EET62846.1 ABC transporter, solute-binding protein [Marvinbryantia formatexigens DSM 14469]UWO23191.1 ABC transporter substrate-binding protein [Marvinbryantia formatexigens DSM 14469]SDG03027.1 multiple sugar transport system substrate-binding protein [Marvinbryantia formatexigens]
MKFRRILALALVGTMALSATAFAEGETTEITMWTYPVGDWGNAEVMDGLIAQFNEAHPEISVKVEYLDYTNGDDQVNTAIEGGQAPDIVFEGPERLVANWGAKGLMVDLADLWTDEAKEAIYDSVEAACQSNDGVFYEYPLCMTAHTMAINRDVFEAADALQYLDEETRTWTTEGFINAVKAVYESGQDPVGAVYCSGQGGDQGTRALVNNLYGGTFTNEDHTAYTLDSEENIKALQLLVDTDGINFDASIAGGDEIQLFCNGTLAMAFCWNVAQEKNNAEIIDFDVLPMAFPSESGEPQLCGGIWGFGIFDNGDEAKIAAAKTFIDFMANDESIAADSVKASTYWPVKDLGNIYEGDELMTEYATFIPYMGDYYQVVGGWAEARTAWWNMLQQIGTGADVATAVADFQTTANAAAGQ